MPTPLPEHWNYDRLTGTLFIWNGEFNEEVATKVWSQDEIKFELALPEEVKRIIVDKMLNYFDEVRGEKKRQREEQIQWVIESVLNPKVTKGLQMEVKQIDNYWEDDCPADVAEDIHKWLKENNR
tara:strand:+ start:402 stop:776 length:375 start_codon:yes stop_codon:yes gene_type:complete